MWRLANQVLVSGKNCCNQRQAVVVLALKAIWAICKSYQKLSKAPSHGVEMSQWRSWDPNFVLYGGPGRLAVWTALARWLQGALAAASVVHLQSLANVLMHHRDLYGPFGAQQARTQKVTKEGSYPDYSWWFGTCLTCFGSRLVYVYVDMFLLDHSGAALLPVEARKPTCAIPVVEVCLIFSWQVLACFGILWSCNSFIFDFVIGAKSPAVGADGPERT